jgi:rubrerythrin
MANKNIEDSLRITSKKEYIQRIREALSLELMAKKNYEEDILSFRNFKIKNTIAGIKKDEERHIVLFGKILDLLEDKA